jgi:hypothetical protein
MVLCTFFVLSRAVAQRVEPTSRGFSPAIEDNSFLIEEAYNQEAGVVQHISTMNIVGSASDEVTFAFTQEWPLFGQEHQVGFTVPYAFTNPSGRAGVGDVLLNYRYQLASGEDWVAASPRISVILPTGDVGEGPGEGTTGIQIALPLSKRLAEAVVMHVNIGTSVLPGMKRTTAAGRTVEHTLTDLFAGASAIWLATPSVNVLLEAIAEWRSGIGAGGDVERESVATVSPGVRVAVDVSALQIVPGIGLPVSFSGGRRQASVFFYLSFEHPF